MVDTTTNLQDAFGEDDLFIKANKPKQINSWYRLVFSFFQIIANSAFFLLLIKEFRHITDTKQIEFIATLSLLLFAFLNTSLLAWYQSGVAQPKISTFQWYASVLGGISLAFNLSSLMKLINAGMTLPELISLTLIGSVSTKLLTHFSLTFKYLRLWMVFGMVLLTYYTLLVLSDRGLSQIITYQRAVYTITNMLTFYIHSMSRSLEYRVNSRIKGLTLYCGVLIALVKCFWAHHRATSFESFSELSPTTSQIASVTVDKIMVNAVLVLMYLLTDPLFYNIDSGRANCCVFLCTITAEKIMQILSGITNKQLFLMEWQVLFNAFIVFV